MAKVRKTISTVISDGEQKLIGLKTISATLNLQNGVSVAEGQGFLDAARAALDEYNRALAVADEKLNVFNQAESDLRGFNSKVLPAIGLKYGKDSGEYESVGGTRDSERKRPVRKPKS